MRVSAKILIAVAAAALCVAACSRGPRIIPRSKMEKIYTDMLLADQWLMHNQDAGFKADTTLFYEPIFRKYGFTTEDFYASNEYYMRDPLRYSRMLKKVALSLDAKARKMRAEPAVAPQEEEMIETTEEEQQ
ncbi:MAG: DUF4296 domain-containing protein [Bacteroidales bacterium]|nr:DUF4296 domain-containing protein [Bacteroidales bacterium]